MSKILKLFFFILLSLTVITAEAKKHKTKSAVPTAEQTQQLITAKATQVLTALKNDDMTALAALVSPKLGVRFTYNTYISKDDQIFKPEQLLEAYKANKSYNWGYENGTGNPIEMSFKKYLNGVVYDHDYLTAKEVAYNKTLHHSTVRDNSGNFYSKAMMVQYYFPGFKKEYEGHDWASLRLFFEKQQGQWYLVGIVNDRWAM